jgi:hypothetical protein
MRFDLIGDPFKDGVDHINIYSTGRTEIGRMLTNMASMAPFIRLGQHGEWRTIEGFWYYVKINMILGNDALRMEEIFDLQVGDGYLCKRIGKAILARATEKQLARFDKARHRQVITAALHAKANQSERIQRLLVASSLPFMHYYVKGTFDKPIAIQANPEHLWQCDVWETIRRGLKGTAL